MNELRGATLCTAVVALLVHYVILEKMQHE